MGVGWVGVRNGAMSGVDLFSRGGEVRFFASTSLEFCCCSHHYFDSASSYIRFLSFPPFYMDLMGPYLPTWAHYYTRTESLFGVFQVIAGSFVIR